MINKLNVFYNDKKVGILSFSRENKIIFQYDESWIKGGFSISPFKLPLESTIFTVNNKLPSGLFGVFNDSFVDSWGELLIRRYLSKIGINYSALNILDKLSYIGNITMGGLTYKPSYDNEYIKTNDNLDNIQKAISSILDNKDIKDIDNLFKLGGSSGGTRPKICMNYHNKDVIVKFKNHIDPNNIANLEYQYMSFASKLGITIPYIELIKGKSNDYFLIERFDRTKNKHIHVITASGLLEVDHNIPSLDYNDLIKLTKILTNNKEDVIQMYKRMVFNVIFNNLDDHSKNFSYYYDDINKTYRLAPAYDLTPGTTYYGEHTTSINGKGKDITDNDMLDVAKINNIDIKVAKDIISKCKKLYLDNKSLIKNI